MKVGILGWELIKEAVSIPLPGFIKLKGFITCIYSRLRNVSIPLPGFIKLKAVHPGQFSIMLIVSIPLPGFIKLKDTPELETDKVLVEFQSRCRDSLS